MISKIEGESSELMAAQRIEALPFVLYSDERVMQEYPCLFD